MFIPQTTEIKRTFLERPTSMETYKEIGIIVEKRVIRVKKVKNAICGTKVTISTSNLYSKENQLNYARLLPSFGYGIPNLVYADPNIHGHDPSQLHCKI